MEFDHERVFDEAKKIALSGRDRARMRAQISAYLREHPARTPFLVRGAGWIAEIFAPSYRPVVPRLRLAGASLGIVLVAGIGTSYAAQNALPGQILYPVKIGVNETILSSLATTPQAKIALDTTLVNTRLDEAEQLAAHGELTPANEATIRHGLASATEDFNSTLTSIASSTPASVAQIGDAQSRLDASLSVHERVLADIKSASPDQSAQVQSILAFVSENAASAHAASAVVASALAQSSTTTLRAALAVEQQAAQSQLNTVRAMSARQSNAPAAVQITAGASSTQQAVEAGNQNLAKGNYHAAAAAFQAAITTGQITIITAGAATTLGSAAGSAGSALLSISGAASTSATSSIATSSDAQ